MIFAVLRRVAACRTAAVLCVSALLVPPAGHAMSAADERALGKKFALAARAQLPLIDDLDVVRYVDDVGQKIVGAIGDQPFIYQFAVVRDSRINAFAVPGGYIYLHGGLLVRASTDDEIAGVLGHEVAHVNGHHLARQQEATQLLNYATLLGVLLSVVQPAIGAGALALSQATQLKYRREFEQEADYSGARYMRQAGYDPRGMLDFFQKLLDEQRIAPTSVPPYLLSHPLTDARLTNLEAVLRTPQWDKEPRRPISFELERVQLLVRARSEPAADVVAHYRRRVEGAPTDPRARYLLGLAYLETGGFEAARETLQTAQGMQFPFVARDLGRAHLRLQQLDTAREMLSRAAETTPDDPLAQYELARTFDALADRAAALRAYERAFQLAPTMADAHYGYGILAGRAGRAGDGFYHLGIAFTLRGDYTRALSQLEKAEPLLPENSPSLADTRARLSELRDFLGRRPPRR